MAKQPSSDTQAYFSAGARKCIFGEEIDHNIVVVARIERYFACSARFGYGSEHIQGLVAIERSDFDRDDIWNLDEAPPELIRKQPATGRRLQIKTEDWNLAPDCAAVLEQFLVGRGLQCSQR